MKLEIIDYVSGNYEVMILDTLSEDSKGFKEKIFTASKTKEVVDFLESNKLWKVNGQEIGGWITADHVVQVLDRKNNCLLQADAWDMIEYLNRSNPTEE